MAAAPSEESLTFGSLACSALLVLVPWEMLRLQYVY
jgi:hypothetical protein